MRRTLLLLPLMSALLLAGCVPVPPAPNVSARSRSVPLEAAAQTTITSQALMNATYSGVYDQPMTLSAGVYEGEHAEGDASRPVVQVAQGAEVWGDLDGDGIEDAAVFLVEEGGGSGVFSYIAAQLNRDGQPSDAGAVRIEDRIQVKSAAIQNGQIVLDIITHGPGDPACCATHAARKTYAVQEGGLVEIAGGDGDLKRVTAADLAGTHWTLLELNRGQPALPNPEVTLAFDAGQTAGSAGCNSYAASFNLGADNPFVVSMGPVAATRKACPDPMGAQETAYLTALGNVTHWGYVYGKLALYYSDANGEQGRLLFSAAAGPQ